MRILQLSTYDRAGGAEKVAAQLNRAFRDAGHNSTLMVGSKFGDEDHVEQIDNRVMPGSIGWWKRRISLFVGIQYTGFPGSLRLAREVSSQYDVVLAHNLHGSYFETRALAALTHEVPTILNLHDMWMLTGHCAHPMGSEGWRTGCGNCCDRSIYPAIRFDVARLNLSRKREALAGGNVLITSPARWLIERCEESHLSGFPKEHVPNPVDDSVFRPVARDEARKRLGLPTDRFVVLYPAHFGLNNPWKDPATLLAALAKTKDLDPLLVAFGDERINDRQRMVTPMVRDDAVMSLYYSAADVTVQASKAETSPLAIVEAMATGCPVIATDVGGAGELIDPAMTGSLVPVGDADALADALRRIESDPRGARVRAEAGRAGVLKIHALPLVRDKWLGVFRRMTGEASF